MHHRFLHPRFGHFLTPDFRAPDIYDPSTFTEPYAYAAGNPVMFWDKNGLASSHFLHDEGRLWVFLDEEDDVDAVYQSLLEEYSYYPVFDDQGNLLKTQDRSFVLEYFEASIRDFIKNRLEHGVIDRYGPTVYLDEIECLTQLAYETPENNRDIHDSRCVTRKVLGGIWQKIEAGTGDASRM